MPRVPPWKLNRYQLPFYALYMAYRKAKESSNICERVINVFNGVVSALQAVCYWDEESHNMFSTLLREICTVHDCRIFLRFDGPIYKDRIDITIELDRDNKIYFNLPIAEFGSHKVAGAVIEFLIDSKLVGGSIGLVSKVYECEKCYEIVAKLYMEYSDVSFFFTLKSHLYRRQNSYYTSLWVESRPPVNREQKIHYVPEVSPMGIASLIYFATSPVRVRVSKYDNETDYSYVSLSTFESSRYLNFRVRATPREVAKIIKEACRSKQVIEHEFWREIVMLIYEPFLVM